jgi:RND family efflux transporter MFP subunit
MPLNSIVVGFLNCPVISRLVRKVSKTKSLVSLLLLSTVGVGWAQFGCSNSAKPKAIAKPMTAVVVAKPIVMPIVEWDEFVGRLEPIESVQVRARVSGYLASTNFEEGQMVRAGDIIAVIDQRPFQAEVSRSEANVDAANALLVQAKAAVAQSVAERERVNIRRSLAKKQFDRNDELRKKNATAIQDFEVSEADYAQAEAELIVANSKVDSAESTVVAAKAAMNIARANLELAKLNLQYTQVRAPIDGRISNRRVTEGNLVSGGTNDSTLLTTIVSLDPIHCYFDADEKTFLKYVQLAREGKRPSSREVRNPVYLALTNELVGFPHQGHMDFVENRLDEETGTIRGRAILPNTNFDLTPGLFARVRLPGSPRYSAILVPDKAIGTDQAEKFVLTVDDSNKVLRKLVSLGPISHGLRIIRSGLDGSERVILSGQQRAKPGTEVTVTTQEVTPENEVLPDEYEPVSQENWLTPKRNAAGNVVVPTTSQESNANSSEPAAILNGAKP